MNMVAFVIWRRKMTELDLNKIEAKRNELMQNGDNPNWSGFSAMVRFDIPLLIAHIRELERKIKSLESNLQ